MSEWPTIAPRSAITIRYVDIMGYTESSTEAYFMWRAKKGPSGASMTIGLTYIVSLVINMRRYA